MVTTEINIDTKGEKNILTKIFINVDSSFFIEGEVVELHVKHPLLKDYAAIKVIKVTKQIIIGLSNRTPQIIVDAERYI